MKISWQRGPQLEAGGSPTSEGRTDCWGEARAEPEGDLNPEVRGQECLLKLLLPKPGASQEAATSTPLQGFQPAGQLQPDVPKMRITRRRQRAVNDRPTPHPSFDGPHLTEL